MEILKLIAPCKDYLWGGRKLKDKYGKSSESDVVAESWELSFHKDGQTKTESGKTLAETLSAEEIGQKAKRFPFFPMLIKFIDARDNLSVQVHPSDDYALQHENSYGKTEMWYVVEAERGAGLYVGFKRDVTREEVERAIADGTLTDLMNFYEVQAGDCYFIPSGTVHAIGKGCLICEIQQNSNLTYRVYDYGRKDKCGNTRELHIDKALKVLDFKTYTPRTFDENTLGECAYFHVEKWAIKGKKSFVAGKDSFVCVTCVQGAGAIDGKPVRAGDSFFVPAAYGECALTGDWTAIVSTIGE